MTTTSRSNAPPGPTAPGDTGALAAVLAVVTGTPLPKAAAHAGMCTDDLHAAVALYHGAGRSALAAQAGWLQTHIQWTAWETAEIAAATHLAARLNNLTTAGVLAHWWYLRKVPCWRLRCAPGPRTSPAELRAALDAELTALADRGVVHGWWPTIYEPEFVGFGGQNGIGIAHDLFAADSRHALDYLRTGLASSNGRLHRRELSVLLCSALFRAAGQDWHEQGDVWRLVSRMRLFDQPPPTHAAPMIDTVRDLLVTDLDALVNAQPGLASIAPWVAAYTAAGHALGRAAGNGTLEGGLRSVLANHVVFAWNRLGIPTPAQAVLAWAAHHAVAD